MYEVWLIFLETVNPTILVKKVPFLYLFSHIKSWFGYCTFLVKFFFSYKDPLKLNKRESSGEKSKKRNAKRAITWMCIPCKGFQAALERSEEQHLLMLTLALHENIFSHFFTHLIADTRYSKIKVNNLRYKISFSKGNIKLLKP